MGAAIYWHANGIAKMVMHLADLCADDHCSLAISTGTIVLSILYIIVVYFVRVVTFENDNSSETLNPLLILLVAGAVDFLLFSKQFVLPAVVEVSDYHC